MIEPNESISFAAGTCEAHQWEASQALDERRTPSAETTRHLATCAECARFARLWRDGAGLAAAPAEQPALTQRVVDALRHEEPAPAKFRVPLARVAAVLALAALGWWLLDPRVSPPPAKAGHGSAAVAGAPAQALARQIARVEEPFGREKVALHTAMIGGVQQVRDAFTWSAGALP